MAGKEREGKKGGGRVEGNKSRNGEDKGCRTRRERHERGGLRVQGRQEGREEKEVLGDLIIRRSSKCCISNMSAWK